MTDPISTAITFLPDDITMSVGAGDTVPDDTSSTVGMPIDTYVVGTIEDPADVDVYRVWLVSGAEYVFDMWGGTGAGELGDTVLTLSDAAGVTLVSNDDYYDDGLGQFVLHHSYIEYTAVTTGWHYVWADAYGTLSYTGAYEVGYGRISGPALPNFQIVEGSIIQSGPAVSAWSVGDEITISWTVRNTGDGSGLALSGLYLSADGAVDPGADLVIAFHAIPTQILPGGEQVVTRTITVTQSMIDAIGTGVTMGIGAYADPTGYEGESDEGDNGWMSALTAQFIVDDHGESAASAELWDLAVGTGYWDSAVGSIEAATDEDWFALTLTAGVEYVFEMTAFSGGAGTLSDPVLHLRDSAGAEVAVNDDIDFGAGNLDSRITYTPGASGVHYVVADGFGTETGTYTLTATSLAPNLDITAYAGGEGDKLLYDRLSAEMDVTNEGGSASGVFAAEIWLESDVDGTRVLLERFEGLELDAGETVTLSLDPYQSHDLTALPLGGASVMFYVDPDDVVLESNETDNQGGALYQTILGDQQGESSDYGWLSPGARVWGAIEDAADVDSFEMNMIAGTTYRITMLGQDAGGYLLEAPRLELRDPGDALVAVDYPFGSDPATSILYRAETTGVYLVGASTQTGGGDYELTAWMEPTPDLAVSNFVIDETVLRSHELLEYSFTATNVGDAGTAAFTPLLQVFDTADGLKENGELGPEIAGLFAGESRAVSGVSALPAELTPGVWEFDLGLDFWRVVGEYDEDNNYSERVTVTIVADDHADDADGATPLAIGETLGGELEIWRDVDMFAVELVAGRTYVFDMMSQDSGVGSLPDPWLGLRDADGTWLEFNDDIPGGGANLESQITWVATETGTFYLSAEQAGAGGGTYQVSAAIAPGPNLEASLLSLVDASLVHGQYLDASWDVVSGGTADASSSVSRLYLSTDAVVDASDVALATDRGYEPLPAGAGFVAGGGWTVPEGLAPGTYWVAAMVDPDGAVAEVDETDNWTNAVQITIAAEDHGNDAGSATAGVLGAPVTGVVDYAGDVDVFAFDLVAGVRYDFQLLGDGGDPLVAADLEARGPSGDWLGEDTARPGGDPAQLSFVALETGLHSIAVSGLGGFGPEALGRYALTAVEAPLPDLTPEMFQVAATEIIDGASVDAVWNIWNHGTADAPASVSAVYLSTDAVVDEFDTRLDVAYGTAVSMGGLDRVYSTLSIPLGLPAGTYWVGVIADAFGDVEELDETNQVSNVIEITVVEDDHGDWAWEASPAVMNGTVTGEAEAVGDPDWFEVELEAGREYRMTLSGDGASPQLAGHVAVYNADGNLVAEDYGYDGIDPTEVVFTAARSGLHQVLVEGDWISGGDALGGYALEVARTPLPDLVVSAVSVEGGADWSDGSAVELGFDVANAGDGDAAAGWRVAFRLSADAVIDGSDRLLGALTWTGGALGAGGVLADLATSGVLDLSGLAPGDYYVGAIIDPLNAVAESDEANAGPGTRITVYADEAGNTAAGAGAASVGTPVHGSIDVDHDEDWWAVELLAGRVYTISMTGDPAAGDALHDPELFLLNPAGDVVAENDDFGDGLDAQLTFSPWATGVFHISANEVGLGTGDYVIEVVALDDHGNDAASATVAPVGGLVRAGLETAEDEDWIAVDLEGGVAYEITSGEALSAESSAATRGVKVIDAEGAVIYDAVLPLGASFSLEVTPPADGRYHVVFDADGAGHAEDSSLLVRPVALAGAGARTIMEFHETSLSDAAYALSFNETYDDPVVIAFVQSRQGLQPVTVRVDELTGTGATLRLQEPNHLDGGHAAEAVTVMVVEAGTWLMPDGSVMQAGVAQLDGTTANGFEAITLERGFDAAPVLLTQVQSSNGADFVVTRTKDVGPDGFSIAMQEEEANNDSWHAQEDVGWVALEAGTGAWGDLVWEAGSVSGVSHVPKLVGFDHGFEYPAGVVAGLSSYAGADPAHARGTAVTQEGFRVFVEEDTSADAEIGHFGETVDYIAVSSTGAMTVAGAELRPVIEFGTVQMSHNPVSVDFDASFENPVLIAFVAGVAGAAAVVVRIDGLDGDGAVMRLQEDGSGDGFHAVETVNFMVVEQGSWMLPNGALIEAGALETAKLTSAGFETVVHQPMNDAALFAQVQTVNGVDYVSTRIRNDSADRFEVAMEEEDLLNFGGHATETVGWVAIESGDHFDFMASDAGSLSHQVAQLAALPGYEDGSLIGQVSSFNGADPVHLRGAGQGASGPLAFLEEDRSRDAEVDHAVEDVDYLLFAEAGVIFGLDAGTPL
ncbi:CARDB domain-containing protein [Rhodovulum sp. DZ06]|uniref:CARDB domain-containing protein n=1 Tax=Rhodovulum sp. DZ06 TaxID=3425126 RepID=UPI003D358174